MLHSFSDGFIFSLSQAFNNNFYHLFKSFNGYDKLQETLHQLRAELPYLHQLIDQAEWSIHSIPVESLLPCLKDVVYDAEDLIDEFHYYELKAEIEKENRFKLPDWSRKIAAVNAVEPKMDMLQQRLNHIVHKIKETLNQGSGRSTRQETTSSFAEGNIFGREKEVHQLINLLLEPNKVQAGFKRKRSATMSVLPIIGIGGVGKTTLAQHIYNEEKVISFFTNRKWVCSSNETNMMSLIKRVLSSFRIETPIDDLECLLTILAEMVSKERFLLVIDDLWDDVLNDSGQTWWRFCASFKHESMILVTTRSSKVADAVCTIQPFSLLGIRDDMLWELMKECVFGSENSHNVDNLEPVGEVIASKLNGSPLAAKTLGCLLSINLDTTHWTSILKSELSDFRQATGIIPTLRFSYLHLPIHLKRCFSFCAVYPKGYKFHRQTLVDIWVAEGFVEPQGAMPIASVGNQYFGDLVSQSMFEKAPGSSDLYIIHDIIHDMAYSVAKDESFIIKDGADFHNAPPNVRHVSINSREYISSHMLRSLCKYKKMRSLIIFAPLLDEDIVSVIGTLFQKLPRIRVFSTSKASWKLPLSIKNWKHLRYLDFSRATFVELPTSFYHLHKIQFLYVSESNINGFVKNISKLPNLKKFGSQSLQIDEGKIILDADEQIGSGIIMLKYLRHFHGSLIVHNLGLVSDVTTAAEAELTKMMYVDKLTLCWFRYQNEPDKMEIDNMASSIYHFEQNSIRDSEMLGTLCPPSNLKLLSISNYRGNYMPIWLHPGSLPMLRSLDLSYCDQLITIELGGALSNLISITVKVCKSISSLHVLTPDYFLCIKKICIEQCWGLAYLPSERFKGFHSLEEFQVVSCPKLKWNSSSGLPCTLKKLYLARCGDVSMWIASCLLTLTSLTDLSLLDCMGITYIPSNLWTKLEALKNLEIQHCTDLVSIGGSKAIAEIQNVHISGCLNLKKLIQPFLKGKGKMGDVEPQMLDKVQNHPEEHLVLQRALSHIQGFINLAEWSLYKDNAMKFIQEAKDTMYDIEDLLDELKHQDVPTTINRGRGNVSSSLFKLVKRNDFNSFKPAVDQIQEKVTHLTILMNDMGLHDERQLYINELIKFKACPIPEEHKIIGREEELRKLIYSLCRTEAVHDMNQTITGNVSVLPIVGCCGTGKTTLAQHVFRDKLVRSYFDIAIWISISDDLVEKKLMKKFVSSVAEIEMRSDDLGCVQRILTKGIINESKRFLLVLDNVHEGVLGEANDEFNCVVELLGHAKPGSKILVTTRSMTVADALCRSDQILLQDYPKESLWKLFKILAFGSDKFSNHPTLDSIGRNIVAKLHCSPLAVKIIGRILSLNLDTEYWKSVLHSELWELPQNNIVGSFSALLLGYLYLPFNLKRCFSLCSIYPKGYEFDKGTLVDCWIAVGLVEPEGDMLLEDAGHLYFEQLVNRLFFQKVESSSKYVLPAFLHDMARHVSENECYMIKHKNDIQKMPPNVRHLSILGQNDIDHRDLSYFSSHKKLLSLVCYDVEPNILVPIVNSLFCESTQIRMLSFISCHMKELPEIIGNLTFLRYLDISACTFDKLPAFLWRLHNLEIVNAWNCKLKELPEDVTNLVKLRRLILKDSEDILGQLREIPRVGKLAFFQEMHYFSVDNGHGRGIGELKHMNFLHGWLEISGLINVRSMDEAAEAELHKKVYLDTLILSWDESVGACRVNEAGGQGTEMLEGLRPNPNLQHLEIRHYMDVEFFPSWFQKDKLPSLTSLSFDTCPNLAKLSIVTAEFCRNESSICFPMLTKLSISRCKRLSSLDEILRPQVLPAIKVIKIEKCDDLLSLPTGSFKGFFNLEQLELRQCWNLNWGKGLVLPPFLKELRLEACGDISESTLSCLHNLVALTTFELQFCHQIESIAPQVWSSLQCLENLTIFYCKGLKSIGGLEAIEPIRNVNITDCPELEAPAQPFIKGSFGILASTTSQM